MELTKPDHSDTVVQVYDYAAHLFKKEKKASWEVKLALIDQGMNEDAASVVVEKVEPQVIRATKNKAYKNMFYGALWCLAGGILTALTYTNSFDGGIYIISWSAIIFGGYKFFNGLSNIF